MTTDEARATRLSRLVPRGRVLADRGDVLAAVRLLRSSGQEDAAVELVANAWRVWIITKEPDVGRDVVAAAVDGYERATSDLALALYGGSLLAFWAGARDDQAEIDWLRDELERRGGP